MNTEEVAQKLVEYCRKGEWMQAVNDLYAKDIVSVEPREMEKHAGGNGAALNQVRGKTEWFEEEFRGAQRGKSADHLWPGDLRCAVRSRCN